MKNPRFMYSGYNPSEIFRELVECNASFEGNEQQVRNFHSFSYYDCNQFIKL